LGGLEWRSSFNMPIDYRHLCHLTTRKLIRALTADGFAFRRRKGHHQRYIRGDGRRVTVSFRRLSDTCPPKTLRTIIEDQAGCSPEDLRRLGLVR
jgi:predicted RNA binding protein YcfA (HicA-like mRNA interferase family)